MPTCPTHSTLLHPVALGPCPPPPANSPMHHPSFPIIGRHPPSTTQRECETREFPRARNHSTQKMRIEGSMEGKSIKENPRKPRTTPNTCLTFAVSHKTFAIYTDLGVGKRVSGKFDIGYMPHTGATCTRISKKLEKETVTLLQGLHELKAIVAIRRKKMTHRWLRTGDH